MFLEMLSSMKMCFPSLICILMLGDAYAMTFSYYPPKHLHLLMGMHNLMIICLCLLYLLLLTMTRKTCSLLVHMMPAKIPVKMVKKLKKLIKK